MKSRQATQSLVLCLTLLSGLWGCAPLATPVATPTPAPPTAASRPQPTPTPISTSTPALPTLSICLTQPGRVEAGSVPDTQPPLEFLIYLPPCYDEQGDQHYPVLYLLHGQTYDADQWLRLGAGQALDELIQAGRAQPALIVLPQDRYWYTESGTGFGEQVVTDLIPYIEASYRTIPTREARAIGGLSRGAGWALRLGLTHAELFGSLGLHSLAVLQADGSRIERWLKELPAEAAPLVFMDIGQDDQERAQAEAVETLFNRYGLPHEWHLYQGAHTEAYWQAHVRQYLEWYSQQWPGR